MKKYPYLVIGGGTAGLRTAQRISKKSKVALIEPDKVGGTCLRTGCIPTKAMLHAAHLYKQGKDLSQYGIKASINVDFKKLMSRVNGISNYGVKKLYEGLAKNKNLDLIKGSAKFLDKNTVIVGKEKITADKIIIATGSSNFVPPIKGIRDIKYLDNVSLLKLKTLPKSLVMIGGGYISMEFATFFHNLGCKVTVLELFPNILNLVDEDVSNLLKENYENEGMKILNNVNIIEIKKDKTIVYNDVRDKKSTSKKIKPDEILVATGRTPNTKNLDLEKAGIKTGKRGDIIVDNLLRTSNKNAYAIGDVNGRAMFAHACKRSVKYMISNLFENKQEKVEFDLMPWAVFTQPVIAGIGLSEKQAKEKKISYGMLKTNFGRVGRAKIIEERIGLVKILFSKKNKKIIGATIIGPSADEIIHEFIALMTANATTDTLRKIIHIHPTLSEVMENLKEV